VRARAYLAATGGYLVGSSDFQSLWRSVSPRAAHAIVKHDHWCTLLPTGRPLK